MTMDRLPGVEFPLLVDRMECTSTEGDKVIARLEGRWRDPEEVSEGRELLLVEAEDGRRHRFPSLPPRRFARRRKAGEWEARFVLPAWLEKRLVGHAELLLDNVSIPLPETRSAKMNADGMQAPRNGADESFEAALPDEHAQDGGDTAASPVSSDPPGDTLAAIHSELQERAAAEASLRGTVARLHAELEARTASGARLEHAQADLRAEFEQLQALIERENMQRAELESRAMVLAAQADDLRAQVETASSAREQLLADRDRLVEEAARLRTELAASHASRDAAAREADGLRAELERLSSDLAGAREQGGSRESAIGEAEALLAEARSLRSRVGRQPGLAGVE